MMWEINLLIDNPSTASGTTGPTNVPSSTSNSQSFFGGNLASNILSGIFDQGSFQQQQQQQQQQQGDRQQSTQENQRAELQGLFGFHAHDSVDDDEGDDGDDDISEDDVRIIISSLFTSSSRSSKVSVANWNDVLRNC